MKQLLSICRFAFLASCACLIFPQDSKKLQEPEYVNVFSFVSKDGVLEPLERQPARMNTKVRALGYGGARTSYVLSNQHSSVRFPADKPLQFIVRPQGPTFPGGGAGANDVDPATIVQLYFLKVTKGNRELQVVKAGMFSGAKNTQTEGIVPFEIAKYGERSIVLRTLGPLPPGEYMWTANASFMVPQGYCFRID